MKLISESFAGVATSSTRVVELYLPKEKRLFDDPYSLRLLPFGWRVFYKVFMLPGLRSVILTLREKRMPGSLGGILCRTRYIDDLLKRSLESGLDQVVILGAGFDSRAYRIEGMDRVQVFEVDFPGTRALKQKRVVHVLGKIPENVTLTGIDFNRENLNDVLSEAGFQKELRTLFIWEGVTQYLTSEAVSKTLEYVSHSSGNGSGIVFTYVLKGLIEGTDRPEWFGPFLSFAEKVGSPLQFGLDPQKLASYLADRGLKLISDVGAGDYQEMYLKQLGRELNVFEGERAVFAEVIKA